MMIIMMNHGYTLIVVLIIRANSTSITINTIMYIPPGLVHNNSIAIHKTIPICIHIHISTPLVITKAIYNLVSGHDHDMVLESAVVDTNNTMDTAMDKGVVV